MDDFMVWPYLRAECDKCEWVGMYLFSYQAARDEGVEHQLAYHSPLSGEADELDRMSRREITERIEGFR